MTSLSQNATLSLTLGEYDGEGTPNCALGAVGLAHLAKATPVWLNNLGLPKPHDNRFGWAELLAQPTAGAAPEIDQGQNSL